MQTDAKLKQKVTAYDTLFVNDNRLMLEWYPERVLSWANGRSMLELGLGHGRSACVFARHFNPYVVVDASETVLDRFSKEFPGVRIDVRVAFFEEFETTELFDHVGMGFVLEHVKDPSLILQRYKRLLNKGGSFFVAVPNAESLHRRLGHLAGYLQDMYALSAADLQFGHRRYFGVKTLTALIESCGLKVRRLEGVYLKPFTSGQLDALHLPECVYKALLQVGVEYPELCNAILMEVAPA